MSDESESTRIGALKALAISYGKREIESWEEFEDNFREGSPNRERLVKELKDIKLEYRRNLLLQLFGLYRFSDDDYLDLTCVFTENLDQNAIGQGKTQYISLYTFNEAMIQATRAFFSKKNQNDVFIENEKRVIDYIYKPFEFVVVLAIDKNRFHVLQESGCTPEENTVLPIRIYLKPDDQDESRFMKCHLYFSASPVIDLYGYIDVNYWHMDECKAAKGKDQKELIDLAEEVVANYPITKYAGAKEINVISNLLKDTTTLDVCSVGEANCILGTTNSKKHYYFDIGLPIYSNLQVMTQVETSNIEKVLSNFIAGTRGDPDYIILSHWHYDHLSGAIKLAKEKLDKTEWLAPYDTDYSDVKNNLKRIGTTFLEAYLIKNNRIYYIDSKRYTNNTVFNDVDAGLYIGTGSSNDINTNGLMLRIKNALLPADVVYPFWPSGYATTGYSNKYFDYIVVPHHGSKTYTSGKDINENDIHNVIASYLNKNGKLIISVGSNKHNLPASIYDEKKINNCGPLSFTLIRTDELGPNYYGEKFYCNIILK